MPKRLSKKLARTPPLARLGNDADRFAGWKHTDADTRNTEADFPKFVAKQTSSGIGKTVAFGPKADMREFRPARRYSLRRRQVGLMLLDLLFESEHRPQ